MAVALAVAAGAMAIGGIVQYMNSERARKASKEQLEEIRQLYEAIKPPDYDLDITDPPRLHQEKLKLPQFSSPESGPKYNLAALEPNQLKVIENFSPKIAQLVVEQEPQLIEKSADMSTGLDAQRQALRKFQDIGEGGFDPIWQQKVNDAKRRAQSEAQSRSASIMQDFERRGIGGSGLELASKMGASSQAMDRNAQLGLGAEAEAYRSQLNALRSSADIGSRLYDQDFRTQDRNAQIINNFNQRMSKRQQDWEQMRADALNSADLRNIQEAQRIADTNTMTKNQYDQNQQQREDNMTLQQYQAMIDERNRTDDINKWKYSQDLGDQRYRDQQNILNAKWMQGEKQNQNSLKSQMYNDQMAKASGIAGNNVNMSNLGMQAARDQNAAIQGLANIGAMTAMNYGDQSQRTKDRNAKYGRDPNENDWG